MHWSIKTMDQWLKMRLLLKKLKTVMMTNELAVRHALNQRLERIRQTSDNKYMVYLVPAKSTVSPLADVNLRSTGFIVLFVFELILFLQLQKSYKHKPCAPCSIFMLI